MAEVKKIDRSLPENLLDEFDCYKNVRSNKNTSQLVREAVKLYIKGRKRTNMEELMKKGYQEMGTINSNISEFGIEDYCVELCKYEAVLAESDIADDSSGEKRRYILC